MSARSRSMMLYAEALTSTEPSWRAMSFPSDVTVAIAVSELIHVIRAPETGRPSPSTTEPFSSTVSPSANWTESVERTMRMSSGASPGAVLASLLSQLTTPTAIAATATAILLDLLTFDLPSCRPADLPHRRRQQNKPPVDEVDAGGSAVMAVPRFSLVTLRHRLSAVLL